MPQSTSEPSSEPNAEERKAASGLYVSDSDNAVLRLDVDGEFNERVASGRLKDNHWVAVDLEVDLEQQGQYMWKGKIRYTSNSEEIPESTTVEIKLVDDQVRRLDLSLGDRNPLKMRYESNYFHELNLHFFYTLPLGEVIKDIPSQVTKVFQEAGFKITTSGPDQVNEDASSGLSIPELDGLMQTFYNRNSGNSGWHIWVLFTSRLRSPDPGYTGLMFDSSQKPFRQGCTVFVDKIQENAGRDPWLIYTTTCHELGHCLNLPHSEVPMLGTPWISGWIQVAAEAQKLSFMRSNKGGDYSESFKRKERFSGYDVDNGRELLFIRHAPEDWVRPGGPADDLFENSASQITPPPNPVRGKRFELLLRRNQNMTPQFKFMEPVMLELRFTNVSDETQDIDEHLLEASDQMIVTIKKDSQASQLFRPYARYCWTPKQITLEKNPPSEEPDTVPKHRRYQSLFVSAGPGAKPSGRNDIYKWYIAEPGDYKVQVFLHVNGDLIPSNELVIHVNVPANHEEETLAQDLFTDDVGRIIALDGSLFDVEGNKKLRKITEKLPDHPATIHALVALGMPRLNAAEDELKNALSDMQRALCKKDNAPDSLGYIDYGWYMGCLINVFFKQNREEDANDVKKVLIDAVQKRNLDGWVLKTIRDQYEAIKMNPRDVIGFKIS